VHIVVISEAFQGRDLAERDDMIWPILDALSDREATQIRLCLLITPDEAMHYFPAEEPTAAQVAAV
jgi:hypothetical protein